MKAMDKVRWYTMNKCGKGLCPRVGSGTVPVGMVCGPCRRVGRILYVVPAGTKPNREIYRMKRAGIDVHNVWNSGKARDHESYLVVCNNKVYWPRVKSLTVIPDGNRSATCDPAGLSDAQH
jgi:hypothetical protein